MATFGPFYPSSLVNAGESGASWIINGGTAEAVISGEGVTDALIVTDFDTVLPEVSVVTGVRLLLSPDIAQSGFNNSDQFTVGSLGEQQAYSAPPAITASVDDTSGLDAAVVLDSSFGFKFSVYAQNGGTVSLSTVALYVDCE